MEMSPTYVSFERISILRDEKVKISNECSLPKARGFQRFFLFFCIHYFIYLKRNHGFSLNAIFKASLHCYLQKSEPAKSPRPLPQVGYGSNLVHEAN